MWCSPALQRAQVKSCALVAITLLLACRAGADTEHSDDTKLSSDNASTTTQPPVLAAIEKLAAVNETENEAEKHFNKVFSGIDFPEKKKPGKVGSKDVKVPKCVTSDKKKKKCSLNRSTRSTTVAGKRAPSISRAFVSLHVPQTQEIKSNSLSLNDNGKSGPGTPASKNKDSEWRDRLRNILDPSKATIKIFVFERPNSNRRNRKTLATSAPNTSVSDSWRRRVDLNSHNKVRSQSDKTKRTVLHRPNIERAQLVFSKDVRGYSPLLQNLLSKTNSVSKSTLVTEQTFHLNQGGSTALQQISSSPDTKSNEIKTHNYDSAASTVKSKSFSGSNPHAFQVQRIPPLLSFSSSDLFYPSLPDPTPRDRTLVSPSVTLTSPSHERLFPNLFPSRVPTSKVKQSPLERSFHSDRPFSTHRPTIPRAHKIKPRPVRHFSSSTSLPTSSAPESKFNSNSFVRLDISPEKQSESSQFCGICQYFDSSAGKCLLDTCCPLRLAGISGVSC